MLFERVGFDAATTRDIAQAATIAAGTLFNYFPTKEAIAVAFVAEAMNQAHQEIGEGHRGESLAEDLFGIIAAELRRLKPCRTLIGPVLETGTQPHGSFAAGPGS